MIQENVAKKRRNKRAGGETAVRLVEATPRGYASQRILRG
jgi:hypothetical protein